MPRSRNLAARRLRRPWLWVVVTVLIAALIAADQNGWLLVRDIDDLAAYHGMRAEAVRIIDGDTLEVSLGDVLAETPVTRIRLWGVDCPEAARFGQPAEPLSAEASALARSLVASEVVLWLEPHQTRDAFGRVLAHVELGRGDTLNEALLEAGLARAEDRWPHARLIRYAQLETAARRRGVGIWKK